MMRFGRCSTTFAVVVAILLTACGTEGGSSVPTSNEGSDDARSAPATARITCTPANTTLETPVVQARRDGVHVEVTNRAGEPVSIYGLTLDSGAGVERHVVQQAPGKVKIGCAPFSKHGEGYEPRRVTLEIADPHRYWIDPKLSCPAEDDMIQSTSHDYFAEPQGEHGDPVELAQARLGNLEDGDVVERAGYPKSPNAIVRVVRDDHVIAALHFDRTQDGGWVLGSDELCSSTGLQIN